MGSPHPLAHFCNDTARACHRVFEVYVDNLLSAHQICRELLKNYFEPVKFLSDAMDTSSCPNLSLSLCYCTITQSIIPSCNVELPPQVAEFVKRYAVKVGHNRPASQNVICRKNPGNHPGDLHLVGL